MLKYTYECNLFNLTWWPAGKLGICFSLPLGLDVVIHTCDWHTAGNLRTQTGDLLLQKGDQIALQLLYLPFGRPKSCSVLQLVLCQRTHPLPKLHGAAPLPALLQPGPVRQEALLQIGLSCSAFLTQLPISCYLSRDTKRPLKQWLGLLQLAEGSQHTSQVV